MRAVLTRAGIVGILIAGCGSTGEVGTGSGSDIAEGAGGNAGPALVPGSYGLSMADPGDCVGGMGVRYVRRTDL